MAGMIIDVIAGKKPEAAAPEEELGAEPAAEPQGGAESLISSIESQLAELRAMMADMG